MNKAQITVKILAGLMDVTQRRIYQLAEGGFIPMPKDGKLPRDESIKGAFKFYRRDPEELKRERLLSTTAVRKLRELELACADGRLMVRADAEREIVGMSKKIKAWMIKELERSGPLLRKQKLLELGVAPETADIFHTWDILAEQKLIDDILARARTFATEAETAAHNAPKPIL